MAEYIERELALSHPFANGHYDHKNANEEFILGHKSYKEWLEDLPTADVKPVVRGKWLLVNDEFIDEVKCSNCGVVEYFEKGWKYYNFCPNCGADMRGESDG